MSACVYCGAQDGLDTKISVKLDDTSVVEVMICAEHAEEATVKTAREAYLKKQDAVQALLAQAKALGVNLVLSERPSGFVVVQQNGATTKPQPQPLVESAAPRVAQAQPMPQVNPEQGIISTSQLDRAIRSTGGNTPMGQVQSLVSHGFGDLKDKLPEVARAGVAKLGTFAGRGGQPVQLPAKRIDGTGTTTVAVVPSGGDASLQRRFKDMAARSRDDPDHNSYGSGYIDRPCPICQGATMIMSGGLEVICPKCKGSGTLLQH